MGGLGAALELWHRLREKGAGNQNKHWRVRKRAARATRRNIAWRVCPLRIVGDLRMIEFIDDAIELNRMSFKTRKPRPELDF
jgi:hypothetical protein